jgi:hypothetical protein
MAIEDEIQRWHGFANALRTEEKEAFEMLMDACRAHASAGSNAVQPVLFEPMTMSIMLSLQKQVLKLQRELDDLKRTRGS